LGVAGRENGFRAKKKPASAAGLFFPNKDKQGKGVPFVMQTLSTARMFPLGYIYVIFSLGQATALNH